MHAAPRIVGIVGIDLGTTHTVVASADGSAGGEIALFPIPQLATATEIMARPLFASCLYAPAPGEAFADAWGDAPWISGELARRRGGEVPGRAVVSAKSWLCHAGVDRTAPILPWTARAEERDAESDLARISPLDASALFLRHVKRAYDDAHPNAPLDTRDVVLTVPASFDEAARELTLLAATRAGLTVRLLEEPQAAFYDFIHRAGFDELERLLAAREEALVLVCDVGGGTTDLSLIRVKRSAGATPPFAIERVAVGQHLLLGGDNMDLALAVLCETRFDASSKIDAARFGQLVSACRGAKERLLSEDAASEVAVSVLGRGSALVGGTLSTRLTRDDAERVVLDGFFPEAPRDARPSRAKSALVAFGLPYERDVAITRHVAWFLARHAEGKHVDALLLNGGVFRAARIRERLVRAIEAWGGPKLDVLSQPDPDVAVARGAVAYGLALRGHGVRIEGGAPRGYYVGVDERESKTRRAVCVVPRGAREGVRQSAAGTTLALVVGRPVRFDLFASQDARVDAPGAIVSIDDEGFSALPPVAVAFETSQGRAAQREIAVALEGELTTIGTLDLACVETTEPRRRFRLAFELRAASVGIKPSSMPPPSMATRKLEQAKELVERAFAKEATGDRDAKDLVRELERVLGERTAWTTDVTRALFDTLSPLRAARRRSADHERVFFMLAGFCVRPGFGDPLDAARVQSLAKLFPERLAFPDSVRGWQQFWIAWRRAAGGLDEGIQTQIRDAIDPFIAPKEHGLKRPKKWKPEAESDMLDMAASLERVAAPRRAELGAWILERTWTDRDPRLWAALGRIGARVPTYASVHHVVPAITAERWLDHLMREKWDQVQTAAQAAVSLARVTGDRARDVGERVRREVEKRLVAAGAREAWVRAVHELVVVEEADRAAFFGEGLPVGLRLVGAD